MICSKIPNTFFEGIQTLDISLSDHSLNQLNHYLCLLLETNKKFNLTATKEPNEAWQRHILNSLILVRFLGDGEKVIDIGSGGGLPGIPLAIVRPDLTMTLLEATKKKLNFLKQL
ncbi:MAG: 16S rRNA (guanine(527)-N(7))-methyltransferase RsmG [Kiritimatiellae bacterium]|nr:16S rRNA (guanine(527)-N(7))-methyltransferase RsmG [Kiritimatiellia bacterium]